MLDVFNDPWFKFVFQGVQSCITIYMTLLAGNLKPHAWVFGLFNQVLWAFFIVATQSWGWVPMCLALTYVYFKNHLKWNKK
jgi:fatty acid desaturase